ncbi:hypothetical protein [Brumimicrobium sp.]|uniref:hypothetical protein n=1 Tax=Brumimicrobium sp. TaxID=2029867 RepID=UPI0026041872|nr:hypothetical protein [uncultured Brumimicrobium sp.]
MKLNFFIVLALGVSIASCSNAEKKSQIAEIETMEKTLDSLSLMVFDTTRMITTDIVMTVRETIAHVKENYMPDTIDYVLADKMNSYKEVRKVLSRNSGNIAKVKHAIPEVQEKLKDLKHDIEKGVNDRDKYQDYINYERNKVDEIKEVWSYYRETTDEYYKLFDSLHPVIKNLGDSLARSAND